MALKFKRRNRMSKSSAPKTVKALSSKVSKLASDLKPELKYYNNTFTNVNPSTTLSANDLTTPIQQGTNKYTRIGDKIRISSIRIGFTGTVNSSASSNLVRMMLLWDNSGNNVAPTNATLFESSSYTWVSPYNLDFVGKSARYKVLYDKNLTFSTVNTPEIAFHTTVPVGKICNFVSGTSYSQKGTLWLCLCSDETLSTPDIDIHATTYYTDV